MLVVHPNSADGKPASHSGPAVAAEWKQIVEPVEPFLQQVAETLSAQVDTFLPEIRECAQYALESRGKQLRPALVALTAATFKPPTEAHVKAATIIEMVHLATLVHDDIMDEAVVRRNRPTLAHRWGSETSVLLGDCLFAHALEMAAAFPTAEVCRVVARATKNVCSGEILQTHRRLRYDLREEDYFHILSLKTGELFALSCDLGAHLSGATGEQRAALREFGLTLGTAYQLYDDCLDVFATEQTAGKSLGTDLNKGKATLPLIMYLRDLPPGERTRLEAQLADWDPADLPDLRRKLVEGGVRESTARVAHGLLDRACRLLETVSLNGRLSGLHQVAGYLAQQISVSGVGKQVP